MTPPDGTSPAGPAQLGPRDRASPPVFKPDHFFLARTEGHGVVRDLTGRMIDRCTIMTQGVWDHSYGALKFDETYVYDSGLTDVLAWTFAPDAQGRMSASEASVTAPVHGWTRGQDYHLRFRRKGGPRAGKLTLAYNVRFTLLEPNLAAKHARIKLFGVTVAEMTAFHRRLD